MQEKPIEAATQAGWGSDLIAEALRSLGIPYVALNPGASFRGLHDSLVNHLGNERPKMLLCLHEENAIAIAHGWAKATDKPMLAIVHSNIGVMHGSMALYNAYCDRVPMLLLGATGPVDPMRRRPFVDWLHTSKDQAAMVRHFVKWDDQPPSLPAALQAIARAIQIAQTPPFGPVYLCFDAAVQEGPVDDPPPLPEIARYAPAVPHPAPDLIERAARLLHDAERPAILVGRVSRSPQSWAARVALAEALGARVFTDRRQACGFPSAHPLNVTVPAAAAGRSAAATLREADVVLSLDWVDLAGMMKLAWGTERIASTLIHASLDQTLANGWGYDTFGPVPTDIALLATPDRTVEALADAVARLGPRRCAAWPGWQPPAPRPQAAAASGAAITTPMLATTLRGLLRDRAVSLIRTPLSWSEDLWPVADPLDYLGNDGAGGMGSAPGMAIGAALAMQGSGRLAVSMFGDGEFLMSPTALWTGVHYRVPFLMIIANNTTYFNDELHQERVARQRGRPVENRWIGQRMSDPEIDVAMLARAQGAAGFGPVRNADELEAVLRKAIAAVDAGGLAVVDVRVATGDGGAARGGAT